MTSSNVSVLSIARKPLSSAVRFITLSTMVGASSLTMAADEADDQVTELPVILTSFRTIDAEGMAADGYKVDSVKQVGPFRAQELTDLPYSINVTSSALMENFQAATPEDAQQLSPFVQLSQRQSTGFTNFINMRGFTGSGWNQKFEEGMRASALAMVPMEDKERMEILTGLSGALYGMASPSGVINYVLKRPTPEPLREVTVGNYGGDSYFVHTDLSDALNEDGSLAYRLNLVAQDGETEVDFQDKERYLISGTLDYQITEHALLQFDASRGYDRVDGSAAIWQFLGAAHPDAMDSELQWGQKWSYSEQTTDKLGAALTWDLSETFSVRSGLSFSRTDREYLLGGAIVSPFIAGPTMFVPGVLATAPIQHDNISGYLFGDLRFDLGPSSHELTIGMSGDNYKTTDHKDNFIQQPLSGVSDFNTPIFVDAVTLNSLGLGDEERVVSARGNNRNILITDNIQLNDQWSAIVGLTHTNIRQRNYDHANTGELTQLYDQSETTPSLSVIYKPQPWLSTYATYIEGLEQGGTAPTTAANAGDLMAPKTSEQYELGAKATVGDVLYTAAVFDIKRANEFTDPTDNIYKQDGVQHNRGIELSAMGKLTDRLTVIGGITLLDAEVEESDNNDPIEVAEKLIKLYAEYDMGQLLPGLTLTGGAFYTGQRAVDTANTEFLPSYTVYNIGARYEVNAAGKPLTLSMNIKNLTDENYWINNNYLGDPRTLTFSANMKF